MKKKFLYLFVVLCVAFQYNSTAQKIYATKTGQIKFNASGGAEEISAINNQADAKFVDKTGQIVFAVLVKGFKFENSLMEDHFNENYMESTKFPKADFKGFIKDITKINFTKEGKYPIVVEGSLTIHGISKNTTANGFLEIKNNKVFLSGKFAIALSDYKIGGSYIGDKIASKVNIEVNCKFD